MKKNMKKILLGIIILLAVAAIFYNKTKAIAAQTVTATPKDFKTWFAEDGKVNSTDEYKVISSITGKVVSVLVEKNSYVKKGDVIGKVDDSDYQTQINIHNNNIKGYNSKIADATETEKNSKDNYKTKIDQLNNELTDVESKIKISDVNGTGQILPDQQISILDLSIGECQTELDHSKDVLAKNKVLYESGVISKNDYDLSEQNYKSLQNKMDGLKKEKQSSTEKISRVKSAYGSNENMNEINKSATNAQNDAMLNDVKIQIKSMKNDLSKDYSSNTVNYYKTLILTEKNTISELDKSVNDCNIISNKDGYITSLPISTMSTVNIGETMATIKNSGDNLIETDVPTTDVVGIKVGDEVQIVQKTQGDDILYTGKVSAIDDWAEDSVSVLGLNEHKVKVSIIPTVETKTLKNGFDVNVRFYSFSGKNCIVLPNSAFFSANDKDYVFVVQKPSKNKGIIKAVEVKKGKSTLSDTVVLDGIKQGDVVVKNSTDDGIAEGVNISWKASN